MGIQYHLASPGASRTEGHANVRDRVLPARFWTFYSDHPGSDTVAW
jgi:hypothetical protein